MKERKMKKILAAILAVGMIAGVASAESNVLSRNAVGYVKTTVQPGDFAMLHNTLLPLDAEPATPSKVFGDSLPVGSQIFLWNSVSQTYQISSYEETVGPPPTFVTSTNWSLDTAELSPGVAFWVALPDDAPAADYDITIMGEVPSDASLSVDVVAGFNMVAYPFPVSVAWTNTILSQNAEIGDQVFLWNVDSKGYQVAAYEEVTGPPPTFTVSSNWVPSTLVIEPGAGIWYQTSSGKTWSETKPYDWP
jgi:hypothetical protein